MIIFTIFTFYTTKNILLFYTIYKMNTGFDSVAIIGTPIKKLFDLLSSLRLRFGSLTNEKLNFLASERFRAIFYTITLLTLLFPTEILIFILLLKLDDSAIELWFTFRYGSLFFIISLLILLWIIFRIEDMLTSIDALNNWN